MSLQISGNTTTTSTTGNLIITNSGDLTLGTTTPNNTLYVNNNYIAQYKDPEVIEIKEFSNRVEIIYEEEKQLTWSTDNEEPPSRTFKIIFSCVDGKFHKSERIYGIIEPAREKQYVFFRDNTSAKTGEN